MILLELVHVSKRFRQGARHVVDVLRDASLELHEGELLAVWGARGSGRSTLLRIAAGIEAPDAGVVRFQGRQLSPGRGSIAGGIAYCQTTFRGLEGEPVLQELIASQLAIGVKPSEARARAWNTLERVGADRCENARPHELDRAEAVRVSIARALLQEPSLLVIDEPTTGVHPLERDRILELLRSLADGDIAVLMSVDKGTSLFVADRALSLGDGELRGRSGPELAQVVALPMRQSG